MRMVAVGRRHAYVVDALRSHTRAQKAILCAIYVALALAAFLILLAVLSSAMPAREPTVRSLDPRVALQAQSACNRQHWRSRPEYLTSHARQQATSSCCCTGRRNRMSGVAAFFTGGTLAGRKQRRGSRHEDLMLRRRSSPDFNARDRC